LHVFSVSSLESTGGHSLLAEIVSHLKSWLDQLHAGSDELSLKDSWRDFTRSAWQQEFIQILQNPDNQCLQDIWRLIIHPDVEEFLYYIYNHSHHSLQDAKHDPVNVDILYKKLLGLVSGALAVKSLLMKDHSALYRWIDTSCASWNGLSPSTQPQSVPLFPNGNNYDLLNACLLHCKSASKSQYDIALARYWATLLLHSAENINTNPSVFPMDADSAEHRYTHLLIYKAKGEGLVVRLHVEAISNGTGDFFDNPIYMALYPQTVSFISASHNAWINAKKILAQTEAEIDKYDYCWWIEGSEFVNDDLVALEGGSHGAALATALHQLISKGLLDPTFAVTAALGENGELKPVSGVSTKAASAFSLKDSNGYPQITRIFVNSGNALEARNAALREGRIPSNTVVVFETLADLISEANGQLEQLRTLLRGEMSLILQMASLRMQKPVSKWSELLSYIVDVRVQNIGVENHLLDNSNPKNDQHSHHEIIMEWHDINNTIDRSIVLAGPGYGKTILLWYETGRRCLNAIKKMAASGNPGEVIDFAVYLPAFEIAHWIGSSEKRIDGILESIFDGIRDKYNLQATFRTFLLEKIRRGDCLITIDALDETPRDLQMIVINAINILSEKTNTRFLISSRREGYSPASIPVLAGNEWEIMPFDDKQIEQVVNHWFVNRKEAAQSFLSSIRSSGNLRYAFRSPLLLRIACSAILDANNQGKEITYWKTRVDLYKVFMNDLLGRWKNRPPYPTQGQQSLFISLASDVSYQFLKIGQLEPDSSSHQLAHIVNNIQKNYPSLIGRDLVQDLCGAGIMMSTAIGKHETSLTFTHRTLGEFLAAIYLNKQAETFGWRTISDDINALADLPEWQEVIIFLAGLLKDPLPLLELLLSHDDIFRHRLALAALCLPEIIDK
jgi:hypothetical protein